jgi:hypothetical protein
MIALPERMPQHVSEEQLEDYARLGRTSEPDFSEVRRHVRRCAVCRLRLNEMHEFVAFMRMCLAETTGEIRCKHTTECGTVFLIIAGSDAEVWEARMLGAGHDTLRTFILGRQGTAYLEDEFARLFPNHRCGRECTRGWK